MVNKIAIVQKDHLFGGINVKNRVKVKFGLAKSAFPFYTDALILVKESGKYGYADSKGKIKIAPIYDEAYPFVNGRAYVKKNEVAGFIDTSGKEVIPIVYKQLWYESEGFHRFAR